MSDQDSVHVLSRCGVKVWPLPQSLQANGRDVQSICYCSVVRDYVVVGTQKSICPHVKTYVPYNILCLNLGPLVTNFKQE